MSKYDIDMVMRKSNEAGCFETYEVLTQKRDETGNFIGAGWYVQDESVREEDGTLTYVETMIWRESDGFILYEGSEIRGRDALIEFLDANIPA